VSEFLFRSALTECRQAIRQAISPEIPVDEKALDEFLALFVADFSELLSHERGDAVWRRDGALVRRLGRYIGTLAEFYAVARGEKETVGRKQLLKALRVVQPECKLRAVPEGAVRQDYCRNVLDIFGIDLDLD
jgi:hypothetical protein